MSIICERSYTEHYFTPKPCNSDCLGSWEASYPGNHSFRVGLASQYSSPLFVLLSLRSYLLTWETAVNCLSPEQSTMNPKSKRVSPAHRAYYTPYSESVSSQVFFFMMNMVSRTFEDTVTAEDKIACYYKATWAVHVSKIRVTRLTISRLFWEFSGASLELSKNKLREIYLAVRPVGILFILSCCDAYTAAVNLLYWIQEAATWQRSRLVPGQRKSVPVGN